MKKLVIFGASFNPPANHHLLIVKKLIESFEKVIIIPRGTDSNKSSTAATTHSQRKDMVNLMFSEIPEVEIDFRDLDHNVFTPTWMIDQKYKAKFPDLEIWHAIGGDLIKDGGNGNSEIQTKWQKGSEIWTNLNWAVIDHLGLPANPKDLPPHRILVKMPRFGGRSTTIRNLIAISQSIKDLVNPSVEEYIIKNGLYR
ncbi:MAG: nicotinate-nicotinamide nucleotide adenylyltransferase [bacterium]|nr:nicotinate-nicotinamide nucleotide adenylyltransferase [bacterium]